MSDIRLHRWALLTHQIPPRSSGFRVRVWRRLQEIGAITLKTSVHILPCSPEALEDHQWLPQEIVDALGSQLPDGRLLEVGMQLFDGLLEALKPEGAKTSR